MNIRLLISKEGRVLLICDSFFKKSVEAVIFNFLDRNLALKFEGENRPFFLNCNVDDYIAAFMVHRKICGLGFESDGAIKQAVYVPLQVENRGQ